MGKIKNIVLIIIAIVFFKIIVASTTFGKQSENDNLDQAFESILMQRQRELQEAKQVKRQAEWMLQKQFAKEADQARDARKNATIK